MQLAFKKAIQLGLHLSYYMETSLELPWHILGCLHVSFPYHSSNISQVCFSLHSLPQPHLLIYLHNSIRNSFSYPSPSYQLFHKIYSISLSQRNPNKCVAQAGLELMILLPLQPSSNPTGIYHQLLSPNKASNTGTVLSSNWDFAQRGPMEIPYNQRF